MRFKFLLALAAVCFLSACASRPGEDDSFLGSDVRAPERVYNSGLDYLLDRQYVYAIDEFKRVEAQYPYSSWVRHSLLMAGFTHYLMNQYDAAVSFLDRFISLYPGTSDISYAYYLRAMCFYEQIGEVDRDNASALRAAQAFRQLIGFFPNSVYARDARLKLDLVEAALAAHEIYIGRWLMERGQFSSAINRFRAVITRYGQTAFAAEALHRQVEIYLTLGLDSEARYVGSVLGHNYPDSPWYRHSYRLLRSADLISPAQRSSQR